MPVSKTTQILDTARTGLIPSCEVPHRPGTGQGVIPGSTPSVFLRIPKNTLMLGSGSRGDSTIQRPCEEKSGYVKRITAKGPPSAVLSAHETKLPMKKGDKVKGCRGTDEMEKKESSTWANY